MKSAVRFSDESGNTCPNYWHYSVYGFCPYQYSYCYLTGTQGIWFSPAVKIYVNLTDIIDTIDRKARAVAQPVSFYYGKLQDGLALEPLTGYMQTLILFFAKNPFARNVLLTKSDAVDSLLSLEHGGYTILSWSLNPPEVASRFEPNTPPVESRIDAVKRSADAGYPVRAVIMPIIPVPDWKKRYGCFLERLLTDIPLDRLIGGICSYASAQRLMERHIGSDNSISGNMSNRRCKGDGRRRYPDGLRTEMYSFLLDRIRRIRTDLDVGLCREEADVWREFGSVLEIGVCNCVL